MVKQFLYFGFCFISLALISQENNLYRPRVSEISIVQFRGANTSFQSESYGNEQSEIENDMQVKVKLAIPLLIKKNKLLGLQLKYYRHQFEFESDDLEKEYQLFNYLNRKKVTNAGVRLLYQNKVNEQLTFTFLAGAEIRSDHLTWSKNSSQFYANANATYQTNKTTKIGGGLLLGQTLGRLSIAPLFILEKELTPKWTLDLAIPKYAALRYCLHSKAFLTSKIELKGWRYNLSSALENEGDLTLSKADIVVSLNYEREIHDWLWFGISAGYSKNIRYYITQVGDRRRDALFQLNAKSSPVIKASIFIVPPRRFFTK